MTPLTAHKKAAGSLTPAALIIADVRQKIKGEFHYERN